MKTRLFILSFLFASLTVQAAPLKKAQFTRVVNDVKTLEEQRQPKAAQIGDVIAGRTSVTTGAQSRAELKFQDNTLTRLGANSVFNMEQGTRNVDLKQGVMLIQVPKQMGGATVRTAAVTAAVTGTTILVEYQPNGYVKIIVVEGELDVFLNNKPHVFKRLAAGDMLITKPDATFLPDTVQVDLVRLKKTSKLMSEKEFGVLGNQRELLQAYRSQQEKKQGGDLVETALVIPGQGTQVIFEVNGNQVPRFNPNTGFPTGTPPGNPGNNNPKKPKPPIQIQKFGRPGTLGGLAVIDTDTLIITDPIVKTRFNGTMATGQGKIYRPTLDGTLGRYLFNESTQRIDSNDLGQIAHVDQQMRNAGAWGAFKFEELYVIDQPDVNTVGGPRNLLLASTGDIYIGTYDPTNPSAIPGAFWNMDHGTVKNLTFAAYNNIYWDTGFSLAGSDHSVLLYTQKPYTVIGEVRDGLGPDYGSTGLDSGDIYLTGGLSPAVTLLNGFFSANAARDLYVYPFPSVIGDSAPESGPEAIAASETDSVIEAADVRLAAKRNVTIGSGVGIKASKTMHLRAGGSLTIQDSTQLRRLSAIDPLEIILAAEQGDVDLQGLLGAPVIIDGKTVRVESVNGSVRMANVNIGADYFSARTLSTNGELVLSGNSTISAAMGMKLYAEGANGRVRFTNGVINLNGPAIIAGKTVQVDSTGSVRVSVPNSFHVHADYQNFNQSGYGNFTNSGGTPLSFLDDATPGTGPRKHNFSSKPPY